MAGKLKEKCECDNPIDPTIPKGYDKQCRRCFELNKIALKFHERAQQAQEESMMWVDEYEKEN